MLQVVQRQERCCLLACLLACLLLYELQPRLQCLEGGHMLYDKRQQQWGEKIVAVMV
jgi:hypothetical protein